MHQSDTKARLARLCARLDHMVPDTDRTAEENRLAASQLDQISRRLFELLPDPSLSPAERLERLARTIVDRTPDLSQLQPATKKLEHLRSRLRDLAPHKTNVDEQVDHLLAKLDEAVAREIVKAKPVQKLEILGDPRGRIAPEK